MQWFTEGFTEYLADRTLLDSQVLSEPEYLAVMARRLGAYVMTRQNPNFSEVSLTAAGARKWRYRPIVYDAGATAAFCLDGRIRAQTKGRASLADAIRLIYADSRAGKPLTYAGVVGASSRAAGEDMSAFFTDYVDGTKSLDLEACARDQGLEAMVHNFDVFLRRPGGAVS
jgi:predicted metalloprotease with PDZ domain